MITVNFWKMSKYIFFLGVKTFLVFTYAFPILFFATCVIFSDVSVKDSEQVSVIEAGTV